MKPALAFAMGPTVASAVSAASAALADCNDNCVSTVFVTEMVPVYGSCTSPATHAAPTAVGAIGNRGDDGYKVVVVTLPSTVTTKAVVVTVVETIQCNSQGTILSTPTSTTRAPSTSTSTATSSPPPAASPSETQEEGISVRTTPTSTTTPTSATVSTCATPTCQRGLEYAMFDNPFDGDMSADYKSFDVNYFKTAKPRYGGVVNEVYEWNDKSNLTLGNAALAYRGYLYACSSGTYRFYSPYADDATLFWFGDRAYSSWNRDNADFAQYFGSQAPKEVNRTITGGKYYPIRVLWGNTWLNGSLSFNIYDPNGKEVLGKGGESAGTESFVTTEACDGSHAPFSPFGQET